MSLHNEEVYLDSLSEIMHHGEDHTDRTGVGTRSIVGMMNRYDLREGFPLFTTRRVPFRSIVGELLWLLSGDPHIRKLQDAGMKFWNPWADAKGYIPSSYARYWRHYPYPRDHTREKTLAALQEANHINRTEGVQGFDQIAWLLDEIRANPQSRRLIVTAWYAPNATASALPPCHHTWQIVIKGEWMDLVLIQRSADTPVGVAFNVPCYSLLLMLIARETGFKPRHLIHQIGDAHIYLDQIEGVKTQIEREPFDPPTVELPETKLLDLTFEDLDKFTSKGYICHPPITYNVAV